MIRRIALLRSRLPALDALLNRRLPQRAHIDLRLAWPLWVLPIALVSQLLTPHPVWIVLLVAIVGIYAAGYAWVRSQAPAVTLRRTREGVILVAGDSFTEEFTLDNRSRVPVLWAEFDDQSDLPGYNPSQIVGAQASSFYRWRQTVECRRRGVYRIGPYRLRLADPFGLFGLEIDFPTSESLLIYPRVAQLPTLPLPRGSASGSDRKRRPLGGAQPAASVRDYQFGDSLRHVHWPTTAHRGALIVKELELEPSGDIWIVLDLCGRVHRGAGETSTLERSIVAAASLTAELLGSSERRAVGLLAASGGWNGGAGDAAAEGRAILLPPQPGQAQLWRVLAALAPAEPAAVALGELLYSSRSVIGRGRSLVVITPQTEPGSAVDGTLRDWAAELLHLEAVGVSSSTLLVTADEAHDEEAAAVRDRLARLALPARVLPANAVLPTLLTYRRTRKVLRSTPTGGVVVVEVEEEVG